MKITSTLSSAACFAYVMLTPNPCVAEPAHWEDGDFAGQRQHISLTVTATLNGYPCKMQIDTGANKAVYWHYYPKSKSTAEPRDVVVSFAGVNRTVPAPATFVEHLNQCKGEGVAGTFGNEFFEKGSLVIDLKEPSLRYVEGSLLSKIPEAQPMFYPRSNGGGGQTFIEVREADRLRGYAVLDTGSTALGLGVYTIADWNSATGDAALKASDQVRAFPIHAWGKTHQCFLHEKEISLQIGGLITNKVNVSFCPTLEYKPPFISIGTVGLKTFGDSTITFDYLAGRWLVERKKAAGQ